MLKIENLCYKYDFCENPTLAVNNISFEIDGNKILAIVGASGSGKSTLAKLISGLLTPMSGKTLLDGKDISKIENLYSKISISLQNPEDQLFCRTIYDEIAFSLKNLGYDSNKIDKLINETANLIGIKSETLGTFPPSLSLGDQRKCAIACSAVLKPKVLILDEPTAGLDSKNKANLIKYLKLYNKKFYCCIIVISHDMELVSKIADEIIILKNAKKVVQDTPKNIFLKYENLDIFGLQKPQINEIIQIVNSNKKCLNKDTYTVSEAFEQIKSKTKHRQGYDL